LGVSLSKGLCSLSPNGAGRFISQQMALTTAIFERQIAPIQTEIDRETSTQILLGVFVRMEQNMNMGSLYVGVVFSLSVIYLLLGLYSDAPWLQPKWSRRLGPAVVPLSRLSRWVWLVFSCLGSVASFANAFRVDSGSFDAAIWVVLFALFLVLILLAFLDGKRFHGKHDPDA